MRRILAITAVALLCALTMAPAAIAAPSDQAIKAKIDAYIVAHPMDFKGINALVVRYRNVPIRVATVGVDHAMTADEAAALVQQRTRASVGMLAGIPTPQIYITSVKITKGVQFWGTWDFPDTWAGQGSPVDIAGQTFSAPSCARMQNGAIWTYAVRSGSTGLGSTRQTAPNASWLWNVRDSVTAFENQADRGTTRVEIVRSAACSASLKNIGAAFDYEANTGGGSITSVSVSFGFFSVSYSNPGLTGHWGTAPIYVYI
jgi:hypothetical protein